jgi:hypothetical protein
MEFARGAGWRSGRRGNGSNEWNDWRGLFFFCFVGWLCGWRLLFREGTPHRLATERREGSPRRVRTLLFCPQISQILADFWTLIFWFLRLGVTEPRMSRPTKRS